MTSRLRKIALAAFLFATVSLGGCAFRSAIERGHDYVAQGHYRAALAEYQQAQQLDPDDEDARRYVAQITPYAVREASAEADAAIAAGRYEDAMRDAAYVAPLDRAAAGDIRERVSATLHAAVEGMIREGRMRDGYALAARARKLVPRATWLDGTLSSLRNHYLADSDRRSRLGDYQGALDSLALIAQYEPSQRARVAKREQTVRGRWADALATRAAEAEREQRRGSAAVLYARAYEVAAQQRHAAELRRLARPLREEGSFILSLNSSGNPTRSGRIETSLEARSAAIEGVMLARDASSPVTLAAELFAPSAVCDQSETRSTRGHEYVAATREVPNPRYQQLLDAIAAQDHQVVILRQRAREARSELRESRERLEQCRAEPPSLQPPSVELPPSDLPRASAPDCSRFEQDVDGDEGRRRQAADDVARGQSELRRLERERSATPQTLTEDVIETFHYPVRHVTRQCSGSAVMTLEPAWATRESHRYETREQTRDDAHAAYPRYGVAGDTLRFTRSDADLVAALDQDAADRALATLEARVKSYYARMARTALEELKRDPEVATEMMVAMLLAAPGALDAATRRQFAAHLATRYGLERWQTLRQA